VDTSPDAAWRNRLRDLVTQWDLPASTAGRLGILLERLAADEHAPTTVRDPAVAVDAHVADALVALEFDEIRAATSLADIGAGAGVPSLVLAAARPELQVFAVESVQKKAAFITQTAQAMSLDNVEVVPLRAEEWAEGHEEMDVVTARAVAPLAVLVEYAAPLLRVGGTLVAWKGLRDPVEEGGGVDAAAATGLEAGEIRAVRPFRGAKGRSLHLYSKVGSTPNRYPRRPGMARKRPLGASGGA
jgi:16S rRNA (guanine527-N7)-methyltransferase